MTNSKLLTGGTVWFRHWPPQVWQVIWGMSEFFLSNGSHDLLPMLPCSNLPLPVVLSEHPVQPKPGCGASVPPFPVQPVPIAGFLKCHCEERMTQLSWTDWHPIVGTLSQPATHSFPPSDLCGTKGKTGKGIQLCSRSTKNFLCFYNGNWKALILLPDSKVI